MRLRNAIRFALSFGRKLQSRSGDDLVTQSQLNARLAEAVTRIGDVFAQHQEMFAHLGREAALSREAQVESAQATVDLIGKALHEHLALTNDLVVEVGALKMILASALRTLSADEPLDLRAVAQAASALAQQAHVDVKTRQAILIKIEEMLGDEAPALLRMH